MRIRLGVLPIKRKSTGRCGHYEQLKVGTKWKCVACGQTLTITESIQNSLELSEVMRSAIDSRSTLNESLDEIRGRNEWEDMRAKIPMTGKSLKRRRC
jgi:hypothetical protein